MKGKVTVTDKEYVVWRDRKGKLSKFRAGKILIGEVRSRKTGKRIGFINTINKKTKKPNPLRFTKAQKTILTTPKLTQTREKRRGSRFKVKSTKPIKDQIPSGLLAEIKREISNHGEAVISIRIDHDTTTLKLFSDVQTPSRFLTKVDEEVKTMIGIDIFNTLKSMNIRMSPKKFAKYPKQGRRRHIKQIEARLVFEAIDESEGEI